MSSISDSAGYDTVLEWLANIQQEQAQLKRENAELKAELAALKAGKNITVVVDGAPFVLALDTPAPRSIALHVVPDFSLASKTGLEDSFLLARDTDEHQAIFTEKTA